MLSYSRTPFPGEEQEEEGEGLLSVPYGAQPDPTRRLARGTTFRALVCSPVGVACASLALWGVAIGVLGTLSTAGVKF